MVCGVWPSSLRKHSKWANPCWMDIMTNTPQTLAQFRAVLSDLPAPDAQALAAAAGSQRQPDQAARRLGAVGKHRRSGWLAGRAPANRGSRHPQIAIFAGNHGVVAQGVSAFPAEVTVQMVGNFRAGGAAINQMAKTFGATMTVAELELDRPTQDFTQGPAMTEADLVTALQTGWDAVDPAADLLVPGEMGIGNTTSAAAIACALFGGAAGDWVGRGTGVDDAGLGRKADAVAAGLTRNPSRDPLEVLRCLGGREIAAMTGAMLHARILRIPVILDGFIACSAAAVLPRRQC